MGFLLTGPEFQRIERGNLSRNVHQHTPAYAGAGTIFCPAILFTLEWFRFEMERFMVP
jgi:hypothetical protein